MAKQIVDMVFEGGGARGLALNGAASALEDAGFEFGRLVGTSAGAITATLIAAGYTGAQLKATSLEKTASGASRMTDFTGTPGDFSDAELTASTLGTFLRAVEIPFLPESAEQRADTWLLQKMLRVSGFAHVFSFIERGGFFSADGFLAWMKERLDADGRAMSGLTLSEMYRKTGKHLSLVVTNSSVPTFSVLNHITAPDVPVLWAVRMSMSIPFFWPEVPWQESWGPYRAKWNFGSNLIVDGGVVSNFALRFLISPEDWVEEVMGGRPDPETNVLGLWLDHTTPVPNAPEARRSGPKLDLGKVHLKVLERIERVMNAALSANDMAELRNHPSLVCRLPTGGYGVTEFDMGADRINALMNAGGEAVKTWLRGRTAVASVGDAQKLFQSAVEVNRSA